MDTSSERPLGSVIMPVKNIAAWIAEAIGTIDHPAGMDLEIICVDDISDDGTVAVIEGLGDPRVRVVRNVGAGVAAGRNTGLANARGSEIYYLDGDDRFRPGAIQRLHETLAAHPEADAVVGYSSVILENGDELVAAAPPCAEGPINDYILGGRFFHTSAFAFRRDALAETGWARTFFRMGEDRDFMLRFTSTRQIHYAPIHVSELRSRRNSVSRSTKMALTKWYDAQADEFHAQRLATGSDALARGEAPSVPDDLPQMPNNSTFFFENKVLMGAAWLERTRGHTATSMRYLLRALREPRYWPHSPKDKLKLLVLLARDSVLGPKRGVGG